MYYFFIIDKMASRAAFGPQAVVWRLLRYIYDRQGSRMLQLRKNDISLRRWYGALAHLKGNTGNEFEIIVSGR